MIERSQSKENGMKHLHKYQRQAEKGEDAKQQDTYKTATVTHHPLLYQITP